MTKQDPASELTSVLEKLRRWQTRAKRASTAIAKLERRRLKLERAMLAQPKPEQKAAELTEAVNLALADTAIGRVATVRMLPAEDLELPTFLQRKAEGEAKDAAARAEIEAQEQAKRATKTRARIEKMKAKRSGATRAEPLSDKAALDYIRSSDT